MAKSPKSPKPVTVEAAGRKIAKMLGKMSKVDRKAAVKFANGVLRLADSINK